jgi:hypothetical protein
MLWNTKYEPGGIANAFGVMLAETNPAIGVVHLGVVRIKECLAPISGLFSAKTDVALGTNMALFPWSKKSKKQNQF